MFPNDQSAAHPVIHAEMLGKIDAFETHHNSTVLRHAQQEP